MDQATLERRLLRCRYLILRAAPHRLDAGADREAFIRELHRAHKKAARILIDATVEIEADLRRVVKVNKDSPEVHRYRHWLAVIGSCCEAFVALGFRQCDIPHLYKGPRFGSLESQNVQSVLQATDRINESCREFAFPLDFTRFSCTGDLLYIARSPEGYDLAVIEVKQGEVNDAFQQAREQARQGQNPKAWRQFFERYGDKGIRQAKRIFQQDREFYKRAERMRAKTGVHRDEDGTRIVLESELPGETYTPIVEALCSKARKGEYAVEAIDNCLMLAAIDPTSKRSAMIGEFDARLFALNAFVAPELSEDSPQKIAEQLRRIDLIDWLGGLGSICLTPLCLRSLRARTFLDLAFGRIRLRSFFHPPAFIELLKRGGLRAELLSKKETNRLRSVYGWTKSDLPPLHEGRAIAYYEKDVPIYVGSMRLHEMVFNWVYPSSVVTQMADAISRAPELPSKTEAAPE